MVAKAEIARDDFLDELELNPFKEAKARGTLPQERESLRKFAEKELLTYLGEYFLELDIVKFAYIEKTDPQTGRKRLLSEGAEEKGEVGEIFIRPLRIKEMLGEATERDRAEVEGFLELRREILAAPDYSYFLWVSPPLKKDYSFTFLYQVIPGEEKNTRWVETLAFRNDLKIWEHQIVLNCFLPEGRKITTLTHSDDLLRKPVTVSSRERRVEMKDLMETIREVLRESRGSTHLVEKPLKKIQAGEENKELEVLRKTKVGDLIDKYIDLLEQGASLKELQKAREQLEKATWVYTNSQKSWRLPSVPDSLIDLPPLLERAWRQERPSLVSNGPCPGTSSTSTLSSNLSILKEDFPTSGKKESSSYVKCPCGIMVPKGEICPKCGKQC